MPIAKLAFMHAVTPTAMPATTPTTMSMVMFSGYAHNYALRLHPQIVFYGGLYRPKSVTETQGILMIHKR